jgi:hypothetical protein
MFPDRLLKPSGVGALWALIILSTGCKPAIDAFGDNTASAEAHAGNFASALEQRFTRVSRSPKASYARMRMARYAFAPSKLANDTALWTTMRSATTGAERRLEIAGTMNGALHDGTFAFTPRPRVGPLARVGDAKHVIALTQLSNDNEWRWATTVENDIGTLPPARAGTIVRALMASMEQSSALIRADYQTASPRTTSALGRMFTMDSLTSVKHTDGSSSVMLQLLAGDTRLKAEFPELAKYVRKYLEPTTMHIRLHDNTGSQWFDAQFNKLRLTIRFRSHNGELQPLLGIARPMPDTLRLAIDGTTKLSFFTVGVSNLRGEFVHVREPTDNAWAMRFTEEPEWRLPLISEKLLRAPLKRPFADSGVEFRIGVSRNPSGQTVLYRNMSGVVQESAIMRFLGNLGFGAMSDFAGKVEEEQNRFVAEWFRAMKADVTSPSSYRP